MASITATKRWTYDDILDWPEDGQQYEIIDGELIEVPSPTVPHQAVVIRLGRFCSAHVEDNALGMAFTAPYDIVLPSGDVLQPDIVVFLTPLDELTAADGKRIVPDLVIEVLSPSTQGRDLGRKRELYAELGVAEYWPVEIPARSIRVLRLRAGRYEEVAQAEPDVVASAAVPGLRVVLDRIFAGL